MFGISLIQYGMTGKWTGAVDDPGTGEPDFQGSKSDYWKKKNFEYPIIQISPELIFANKVQLLDANFISEVKPSSEYSVALKNDGILSTLRKLISSWYVTLRTIAIIGLLSVLIYIGIRIIISSTGEKAKYKERLVDWIIAFCLLFFMHYIMAGLTTVVERVDNALSKAVNINSGLTIDSDYGTVKYTEGAKRGQNTGSSFGNETYNVQSSSREEVIKTAKSAAEEKGAGKIIREEDWTSDDDRKVISDENGASMPDTNLKCNLYEYDYTIYYENYEVTCIEYRYIYREGHGEEEEVTYSEFNYDIKATGTGSTTDEDSDTDEGAVDIAEKDGIKVSSDPSKVLYFINYARLFLNEKADDKYTGMATAYLIIYIALVVFTAVFAIRYIKRVVYIALLTLFAPMVALTYPLDKMKDRKSTSMEYVV